MGWFNNLHQFAKQSYNKARDMTRHIYGGTKQIVHRIGDAVNKVDNLLLKAENLPVVGEVAHIVRNNPIYGSIHNTVDNIVKTTDDLGDLGTAIDAGVESGDFSDVADRGRQIFRDIGDIAQLAG